MTFPCPSHLPTVIHANIINALAGNAAALGLSELWLLCVATSPFGQRVLDPRAKINSSSSVPDSLRPTELQLSLPHHPWIDVFPIPRLRDNILMASYSSESMEDELWYDMVEMRIGRHSIDNPSLIVWGRSWDIRCWEATPAFVRKWGVLIEGCPELLESTNYWRRRRGQIGLTLH